MEDCADTLVAVPLDDLHAAGGSDNLKISIESANKTLGAGVALIWRMVCMPGYIQLDSERLRSMIVGGKKARLGFAGSSNQLERSAAVLDQLAGFKLLCAGNGRIAPAEALFVGIIGGDDLRLSEIKVIMNGIGLMYRKNARIEMGTVQDPLYDGRLEVVLFAFQNRVKLPDAPGSVSSLAGGSDEPPIADLNTVLKHSRKPRAKGSKLTVGPTGRGKFQNCEPTIYNGVDLDLPAYLRYGLNIEK